MEREDPFREARRAMVEDQVAARGVQAPRVVEALRRVPREAFVPEALRASAYADHALPLEEGQTLSQPYIVGLMTEAAAAGPGRRILEVGTGSGYQTAVLAETGAEVWTVERLPGLARAARGRLEALGYGGIRFRVGDGSLGWPEAAPFDAILVTAAAREVPAALPPQLAPGGRLIIPVGAPGTQRLLAVAPDGSETFLEDVRFVPLVSSLPAPPLAPGEEGDDEDGEGSHPQAGG